MKRLRILSTSKSENGRDNTFRDKNFNKNNFVIKNNLIQMKINQFTAFIDKFGLKLGENYSKIEHFYLLLVTDKMIETIVEQVYMQLF